MGITIEQATEAIQDIIASAYTGDPNERYDNALIVVRFLYKMQVMQRLPYNHKSEKGY